jgi:anti-sigma factor ChrR (cupin superfamily)
MAQPEAEQGASWTVGGVGTGSGIHAPVTGSRYISAGDSAWQLTESPGFWIKPLYDDLERGEKTMLMKVDAGAFSPSHTHDGEFEQIFVIQGSFHDQNGTLRAGDYCCRAPDAAHTAGSEEGAVVLLVYTRRDPRTQR